MSDTLDRESGSIKMEYQQNLSGDRSLAAQGFGRLATSAPPKFDPARDRDAACAFFEENGFVVLSDCLNGDEIRHLNEFYDRTQNERPDAWGLGEQRKPHHRGQGLIFSQPLLDYPELDPYTRHPRSFPMVCQLMGAEENVRFSEFNFREAPPDAGHGAMNFHHDAVVADRLIRSPYMPVDWLCAIHYLTDVDESTTRFLCGSQEQSF